MNVSYQLGLCLGAHCSCCRGGRRVGARDFSSLLTRVPVQLGTLSSIPIPHRSSSKDVAESVYWQRDERRTPAQTDPLAEPRFEGRAGDLLQIEASQRFEESDRFLAQMRREICIHA